MLCSFSYTHLFRYHLYSVKALLLTINESFEILDCILVEIWSEEFDSFAINQCFLPL